MVTNVYFNFCVLEVSGNQLSSIYIYIFGFPQKDKYSYRFDSVCIWWQNVIFRKTVSLKINSFLYRHPEPDEGEHKSLNVTLDYCCFSFPVIHHLLLIWYALCGAAHPPVSPPVQTVDTRGRCAISKRQYLMQTVYVWCWTDYFYLSGQKSLFSLKTV